MSDKTKERKKEIEKAYEFFEDSYKKLVNSISKIREGCSINGFWSMVDQEIYNPLHNSQYHDVIKWYRYWFNEETKSKVGLESEGIKRIHVMPYRITENDVKNAKPKGKDFLGKLSENRDYVDYDHKSGNFHKMPSRSEYQIVITTGLGPGFIGKINGIPAEENIKNEYYFPRIFPVNDENDFEKIINKHKDNLFIMFQCALYQLGLIKNVLDEDGKEIYSNNTVK